MRFFLILLFIIQPTFSQNKTMVVDALHNKNDEFIYLWHISENKIFEDQKVIVRRSFPKDAISLSWDEGYYITDISYGDGYWSLVTTKKKSDENGQKWSTVYSTSDLHDKVKEGYDENYNITDICYGKDSDGDNMWVLVMTKISVGAESFSTVSPGNFQSTVKEKWDEGYDIIDLSYGKDKWAVVFRKGTGYSGQTWFSRNEFPVDKIKQSLNEGKILTSFAWKSDFTSSMGVVSKVPNYNSQSFETYEDTLKYLPSNSAQPKSNTKPKPQAKPKPKVKKAPPKGVKID